MDGSYGSVNDSRLIVGLGTSDELPRVDIEWPDGREEHWLEPRVDGWSILNEGSLR